MFKLLRSNPTIAAGILLPLSVAVFFVLATAVPRWLEDPPAYDLLFMAYEYRQDAPAIELRFDVADEALRVRAYRTEDHYRNVPRLYRYAPATDTVDEITVELPPGAEDLEEGTVLDIPELRGSRVSAARRAPDGYEVTGPEYRRGGLMGLFFGRRQGPGFALRKGAAVVDIPDVDGRSFYYGNVSFLAWILEDDG